MSRKQILTAWSKSSSREQATHKAFSEKMVAKTIVNSGCNMIINSTPDLAYASNEDENGEEYNEKQIAGHTISDFEEAEVVEEAPTTPAPAKPEPVPEAKHEVEEPEF